MKTLALAKFTLLSLWKKNLRFVLISLLAFYVLFYFYLKGIAPDIPEKVLSDLTLSLESVSLFACCLLLVCLEIPEDIRLKKCYFLLSKGISRTQYLLGKFGGIAMAAAIFLFAYSFAVAVFLSAFSGISPGPILSLLPFFLFKSLVWISILILISLSGNTVISLTGGCLIYFLTNFHEYLRLASAQGSLVSKILNLAAYVLPNLEYYNLQGPVVHRLAIPALYWLYLLLYTIAYISFMISLAGLLIDHREL
ncbi:MAG: hypothetical protein PHW04_08160 [Candidatus Wallbacteria bacterium]|nr:hypothetical protein [Candidatus Wallbacteria bacterium]